MTRSQIEAASERTRSELLVARARHLAHEETRKGNASPLVVALLELAAEHEILIRSTLKLERCVHDLVKEAEKDGKCKS